MLRSVQNIFRYHFKLYIRKLKWKKINERARHVLKTKMTIALEHRVATFLALNSDTYECWNPNNVREHTSTQSVSCHCYRMGQWNRLTEPAAKKPSMGLFSEWSDVLSTVDAQDEFHKYLSSRTLPLCSPSELLSFWKSEQIK